MMTEERVIREIRIDEATGRGDSDSRMTCFEVIMPLKLQSTKTLIYSVGDQIKSLLHYTISIRTVVRNDENGHLSIEKKVSYQNKYLYRCALLSSVDILSAA